jgi:hypothetical protein
MERRLSLEEERDGKKKKKYEISMNWGSADAAQLRGVVPVLSSGRMKS